MRGGSLTRYRPDDQSGNGFMRDGFVDSTLRMARFKNGRTVGFAY